MPWENTNTQVFLKKTLACNKKHIPHSSGLFAVLFASFRLTSKIWLLILPSSCFTVISSLPVSWIMYEYYRGKLYLSLLEVQGFKAKPTSKIWGNRSYWRTERYTRGLCGSLPSRKSPKINGFFSSSSALQRVLNPLWSCSDNTLWKYRRSASFVSRSCNTREASWPSSWAQWSRDVMTDGWACNKLSITC